MAEPDPQPPKPPPSPPSPTCPHSTDPPLLSQHSTFKTYRTSTNTYSKLRTFYRPHPQASELPTKPAPLPLLVFVHGLGGSVAQFHPLLSSLVHIAPCLAVDLPGCGRSAFVEKSWAAYTQPALAELLGVVIEDHRDADKHQGVVLVGHSMGTSLCALLASGASPALKKDHVKGVVAICPVASGPERMDLLTLSLVRLFFWVPGWLFNLWRKWDRRGGVESQSVRRFVGEGAELELRALQHKFNEQSKTPVWRRMARACVPTYKGRKQIKGLAGEKEWRSLNIPVFLIGGEADKVTSPKELDKIVAFLQATDGEDRSRCASRRDPAGSKVIPDSAAPVDASPVDSHGSQSDVPSSRHQPNPTPADPSISRSYSHHEDPITPSGSPPPHMAIPPQPTHPRKVVKTQLLPSPANHTLLYHPSISRTAAGLIADFLTANVSPRLSLAWQLQHLSREGKWDVKNLAKWKKVTPVSKPIGPRGGKPVFRAMKTLREADEEHCPSAFAARWAEHISGVVDISHDQPVYDSRGLEKAGVQYYKFPTVSKIPPSAAEVSEFIDLIDRVRAEKGRAPNGDMEDGEDNGGDAKEDNDQNEDDRVIGVHCHYGFNRTGYFIVCYLVERCGMTVQEAIDEFAAKRPNGIRHTHFLDRLFVRYQIGEGDAKHGPENGQ